MKMLKHQYTEKGKACTACLEVGKNIRHIRPNPNGVVKPVNPARTFQVGLPDNPLIGPAKTFIIWVVEGFGISITFSILTGNTTVAGAIWLSYIGWRIVRG